MKATYRPLYLLSLVLALLLLIQSASASRALAYPADGVVLTQQDARMSHATAHLHHITPRVSQLIPHTHHVLPAVRGKMTKYLIPSGNCGPYDIMMGSDGNLWFTITPNAIGSITTY